MEKTRRAFSASFIALAAVALLATQGLGAQVKVAKPVKLQIIDVAGNLTLSKAPIEAFKAKYPDLVSDIEYIKLTAPELPAKLKAQQMAGVVDTTLVLTGTDGMASGIDMDVYTPFVPTFQKDFQKYIDNYLPGAKAAFDLFKGVGLVYTFCPGAPMFTYNPDKVPNAPKTAADLLAWAKANPGKFMYARPANSGPGKSFVFGLPYILGDKDPKDPKTWTKTWAYLKELDQYIDYYPSGTSITFKELAEGTRWILASHAGWDVQQRSLATIPATFKAFWLQNSTWINDAHFMAIPKGLEKDKDRMAVTLELMKWLMSSDMQAYTFGGNGYFYPGPSQKGVSIDMAPAEIQKAVKPFIRPETDKMMLTLPSTPPLGPAATVEAFDTWDQLVGAKVKK
jgi:putative spermidine/putrescine transport system substrate-binding protein